MNEVVKRPKSVTVVSWLLIIRGGLTLIYLLVWVAPVSVSERHIPVLLVVLVASLINSVFWLVTAIGMLKGHNWAKILYLAVTPIILVSSFLSGIEGPLRMSAILWVIFYLILFFALTTSEATAYFKKKTLADVTREAVDKAAYSLLSKALRLQVTGEIDAALSLYQEVVNKFPGTSEAQDAEISIRTLKENLGSRK